MPARTEPALTHSVNIYKSDITQFWQNQPPTSDILAIHVVVNNALCVGIPHMQLRCKL